MAPLPPGRGHFLWRILHRASYDADKLAKIVIYPVSWIRPVTVCLRPAGHFRKFIHPGNIRQVTVCLRPAGHFRRVLASDAGLWRPAHRRAPRYAVRDRYVTGGASESLT